MKQRQISKHLRESRGLVRASVWGICGSALLSILFLSLCPSAQAQMDQGVITGAVQDKTGAVVPGAQVALTNAETGVAFHATANASGRYAFPPVKVGNYTLEVSSPGFQTLTQENIHLNVQDRLNIISTLVPGAVSESVTVTAAPPPLQTQDASVGEVMSTRTIDDTPLNGRNWVYIAQLAPGVAPSNGSRGTGKGDFNSNGQRAEQNNFILNGIDNNSYAADFMNGSSYALQPPPDALSEFKIQTADFSAEFGHSAGAVVNASIKSGTNSIHGNLYEYLRNDAMNARNFGALTIPEYRENQFGGTLGGPVVHDKVFLFGYAEANRIVSGTTFNESVPTALMRQGNFSELLTPSLTSSGHAIQLYEPGSAGSRAMTCGGQANVMCTGQIDSIAQNLLNQYPLPNTNGGKLYNNYIVNRNDTDNTWQWGLRLDANLSPRDQLFVSFSNSNEIGYYPPPLGPIIDSGAYGADGSTHNLTSLGELSETHEFSSSKSNEFRVGLTHGRFGYLQVNPNQNTSANLGLGGIPFNSIGLGGLPNGSVSGIAAFGPAIFNPAKKDEDVLNLLDNVTLILGNHSIRTGFYVSNAKLPFLVASYTRGTYTYSGYYTSNPGSANTGFGVADLLADEQASAEIGSDQKFHLARLNLAGYVQDDWTVSHKLTLNLGVRYEYFQPVHEMHGLMANLDVTSINPGTGAATLLYPKSQSNLTLSPNFTSILNSNNVGISYSSNRFLTNADHADIAPRIGFAYMLDPSTVVRGGFGTFYGGLQNPSLNQSYPFQFDSNFASSAACLPGNCPTDGITLEQGFSAQINGGLINDISKPGFFSANQQSKTQYSENFNLSAQRSLTQNMTATLGYIGSVSRHLAVQYNENAVVALIDPRLSSVQAEPFPGLGSVSFTNFSGAGSYNALQARLVKRFAAGLSFLAAYTWSHSLDDGPTVLGTTGDSGFRAPNIIGESPDYSNSGWDVRHRVTFNGYYDLPFGSGRRFVNNAGWTNVLFGGWSADLEFIAQTGFPFTVSQTLGSAGPNGATAEAIMIRNPFAPGGSPDPSNPGVTCAQQTRTVQHWYNPCAFANPPAAFPSASISGSPISTTQIRGLAALPYLGGRRLSVSGPGYERINMSLFKEIPTFEKQYLRFRADAFNVLNTPAYAIPSVTNNGSNGGQITGTRFFQNLTPDARFFQISASYVF